MALLFIGRAFLSNVLGSLIGGPEISTARSGTTGAGVAKTGDPARSPAARAREIAPSLKKEEIPF